VFLMDSIKDPASRRQGAAIEYEETRQGVEEIVDDFIRRLDVLEEELGRTDDRHRADTLFIKLRPDLWRHLLHIGDPPSTRQEVLRLARRMEAAEEISGPSRDVAYAAPIKAEGRQRECRFYGDWDYTPRYCPKAVCRRYKGKGHFALDCDSARE
jgi:hypothetical protein